MDIPEINLIESDFKAVKNAIIYNYSNGVTEGLNNKTKVIKKDRCMDDVGLNYFASKF